MNMVRSLMGLLVLKFLCFFVLAPGICVHMVAGWLTGGVGHSRNYRRAHEQTNYDVGRNDCYLCRNESIPCLPFLYVENKENKNLVFGFCVRLFQCRTCTFNNFILTRRWRRRSQSGLWKFMNFLLFFDSEHVTVS